MLQLSVVAIILPLLHLVARVARVTQLASGAMPTPCSVKMAAALDAAVAPFGSEAGLLEDGLGLTPARLAAFRGVLLD